MFLKLEGGVGTTRGDPVLFSSTSKKEMEGKNTIRCEGMGGVYILDAGRRIADSEFGSICVNGVQYRQVHLSKSQSRLMPTKQIWTSKEGKFLVRDIIFVNGKEGWKASFEYSKTDNPDIILERIGVPHRRAIASAWLSGVANKKTYAHVLSVANSVDANSVVLLQFPFRDDALRSLVRVQTKENREFQPKQETRATWKQIHDIPFLTPHGFVVYCNIQECFGWTVEVSVNGARLRDNTGNTHVADILYDMQGVGFIATPFGIIYRDRNENREGDMGEKMIREVILCCEEGGTREEALDRALLVRKKGSYTSLLSTLHSEVQKYANLCLSSEAFMRTMTSCRAMKAATDAVSKKGVNISLKEIKLLMEEAQNNKKCPTSDSHEYFEAQIARAIVIAEFGWACMRIHLDQGTCAVVEPSRPASERR